MRQKISNIVTQEFGLIFKNRGVVLILLLAPLIYALLYSLSYDKQVVERVPIAVIDNSHSHSSRQLISHLTASPYLSASNITTDMEMAKQALFDRTIYGIVFIPSNYEQQLLRHEQATLSLYFDGSYFLMYRQVFQGVIGAISAINKSIAPSATINYRPHTLFNPQLGYGTFIMPAILLVILQQTAIMAIGTVGGVWSEHKLYRRGSAIATFIAKSVVYFSICLLLAAYILTIHYRIFNYPINGLPTTLLAVIIPYVLAFVFLGITISTLFHHSESALLSIVWTSIPALLLSGASLPIEAFPRALKIIGKVLPSSSAVPAFIRAQSMGADSSEIAAQIATLWVLSVVYGLLAIVLLKKRMPES